MSTAEGAGVHLICRSAFTRAWALNALPRAEQGSQPAPRTVRDATLDQD
jgi:hypothetical protein